jgi:DNA-binding response OmpR family regulator
MASSFPAKKILAVDDNPVILKVLTSALEPRGYEVFTALDGSQAFSIARREKPDMYLLDILFPPDATESGNTWDAFLIMQWLQHMGEAKDKPVIIISGAEPEKYKTRCLAAGAQAFLPKPLDPNALVDTVQNIFSRSTGAKATAGAVNFDL